MLFSAFFGLRVREAALLRPCQRAFARNLKSTTATRAPVQPKFDTIQDNQNLQKRDNTTSGAIQQPRTMSKRHEDSIELKNQMMLVDRAETVEELLKLQSSSDKVMIKVQALERVAQKVQIGERRDKDRKVRERTVNDPAFKELVAGIKREFTKGEDGMNDIKRSSVLFSLMTLKYRDDELLESACDQVMQSKQVTPQTITNLLYVLAKSHYKPDDGFLKKAASLLKSEVALPVSSACRNLWNFQALNYYDKDMFDLFGKIIVKNFDQLSEIDVANSLSSFAHFKHINTDQAATTLECLVRTTIRHAKDYGLQSLAVITNALAELEVKNTTVFSIVKNVIIDIETRDQIKEGQEIPVTTSRKD